MERTITRLERRNEIGNVDETFVTRNDVPVDEFHPFRRRRVVSAKAVLAAFARLPEVDARRLRDDLDHVVTQDPTPRG